MGAQFLELSFFFFFFFSFFFLRGNHYCFLDLADLAASKVDAVTSKVDAVTVGILGWGETVPGICSPG